MKKITSRNYYIDTDYMSVSQFKNFQKCPAMAMAMIRKEWQPERTRALLLGSYVDERLTGTPRSFQKFENENTPELYKKNGEPYADIAQAEATIVRIKEQPLMMKYLGGQKQKIMTGEIEGVPFKIKMDSYKAGEFIADLKYMSSMRSPNMFTPMIDYWGYDIQAAVYREIVRQNTGDTLPFYFVVATKETPAHLAVGEISDMAMDAALEKVKANVERFHRMKLGELPAPRCEGYGCDYCAETAVLTEPIDTDQFGWSAEQWKTFRGEI